MKQNRMCEICGNRTDFAMLKEIKYQLPSLYRLPSAYEVVACKKCGFCYANTSASLEDYDYYYANYNYYSKEILTESSNNVSENTVIDILDSMCQKSDKILDIGFGKGKLLLLLQKSGYKNLFGIDPSLASVDNIQKSGIQAEVGNIYELDSAGVKAMDVVIIAGVLEHLLKPSLALKNITNMLKNEGILIVTVPNCLNLANDLSPLCNSFNQEHINYFSTISLRNLMASLGFREERSIAESRYTDILAVFRYDSKNTTAEYEKDQQTELTINKYVEYNNARDSFYNQKLDKYVKEQIPIAVWGTGAFCMSLLSNTDLEYCKIICFIDNNEMKCGNDFFGKIIIAPKDINNYAQVEAVVIASIKSAVAIKGQLLEAGWNKNIIILDDNYAGTAGV